MRKNIRYLTIFSPILSSLLLFGVMSWTNPLMLGPVGIMGVFVLIYVVFLTSLFVGLHFGISWISRLMIIKQDSTHRYQSHMGVRKAYYIASVVAFVPVLFLAMRSFAELRMTDVLLVAVFVVIAVFYIIKRT